MGPLIWTAKTTVLALYIRVFGSIRWLRITSLSLIVFMFLFYWLNLITSAAYCTPRTGEQWDPQTYARCQTPVALTVVVGVLDVVTDVAMYILPFPIINSLQLSHKKRIGLRFVFAIGFVAIIAGVAALGYRITVFLGNDPIWNGTNVALITFVEVHVTIMVSCAPALSSFWFNIVTPSKFYSSLRSNLATRTSRSKENNSNGRIPAGMMGKYDSSTRLKQVHGYPEMNDSTSGRRGGRHTKIDSGTGTVGLESNDITRSVQITQSSEQV
ncbi:MAG: hypothetical protein Q9174_002049 [Haloplaca sp. 1 TL-2023]